MTNARRLLLPTRITPGRMNKKFMTKGIWQWSVLTAAVVVTLAGCKTCWPTGEAPKITQNPQGATVAAGDRLTLRVAADGTRPLHYLWRHNGVPLNGERQAELNLSGFRRVDAGDYDVVVWNRFGTNLSRPSVVSSDHPVVASTDRSDAPAVLTGSSGALNTSNRDATREPGEPRHADEDGGASIWFSWRAPSSGLVTFDTLGSSFDTVLAVYRVKGEGLAGLREVRSDDDAGPFFSSAVTFNLVAEQEYRIAVDGLSAATGNVALNWRTDVRPNRRPPNILERPPTRLIAERSQTVKLTVVAEPNSKDDKLAFQWFRDDAAIANATASSYAIHRVQDGDAGVYRVVVSSSGESVALSTVLYVAHTFVGLATSVINPGSLTVPVRSLTKAPLPGNCAVFFSTNYSLLPTNCFPPPDVTQWVVASTNAGNGRLDTFLRTWQRSPA